MTAEMFEDYTDLILRLLHHGILEPAVKVVGIGGAGNNVLERMHTHGTLRNPLLAHIERIAINTDAERLESVEGVDKKIIIGKGVTRGRGVEGFPEVAEYSAEIAAKSLSGLFVDADLVFLISAMGGGTGNGATPVIATLAKEQGAVVFCMAIMPFSFESEGVKENARKGVQRLREITKSVVCIENDAILNHDKNMTLSNAFLSIDKTIIKVIEYVMESVNRSFISSITEDLPSIISQIRASLPVQEVTEETRPEEALPLLTVAAGENEREIEIQRMENQKPEG